MPITTQTGFERPALLELVATNDANLAARLGSVAGDEQRSLRAALARVDAEAQNTLYAYIDSIATEALPDTAVEWLVRHADWRGVTRVAAVHASGFVVFTGSTGAVIPLDQRLVLAGREYAVDAAGAIGEGGNVTLPVSALLPGLAGNQAPDTMLALLTPLAGVNAAVAVADSGIAGGADIESIDALRERLRAHVRRPPHGGSLDDYVKWAKAHSPAITACWPKPQGMGAGTVVMFFAMHDTYADGIPLEADVTALQAYYDRDDIAPIQSQVYVVAPLPQPIIFQIGSLEPATLAVKAAIEAGLRDLIRTEAAPYRDLLLTHVQQAISLAAGEHDHTLIFPADNLTPDPGKLFTFGGIEWG